MGKNKNQYKSKEKRNTLIFVITFDAVLAILLFLIFVVERKGIKNPDIEFELRGISLEFLTSLITIIFAVIGPISDARAWSRYDITSGDFKKLEGLSTTIIYMNLFVVSCVSLVLNVLFYVFSFDMSLIALLFIDLIYLFVFVGAMIVQRYIRRDYYIDRVSIRNEVKYFERLENKDKSEKEKDEIITRLITNRMVRNGFLKTKNEICTAKNKEKINFNNVSKKLIELFNQNMESTYLNGKQVITKNDLNTTDVINGLSKSLFEIASASKDIFSGTDDTSLSSHNIFVRNIGYTFMYYTSILWSNPDYAEPKKHFIIRFQNILQWYEASNSDRSIFAITLLNSMISKSIYEKDTSVLYLFNDVLRKSPNRDREDNYFLLVSFYLITISSLDKRFIKISLRKEIRSILGSPDWTSHFAGLLSTSNANLDEYSKWYADLLDELSSMCQAIDDTDWMVPEYTFVSTTFVKYDFNKETIKFIWFLFLLINTLANENGNILGSVRANLSEDNKKLLNQLATDFLVKESKESWFSKVFLNSAKDSGLLNFGYSHYVAQFNNLCNSIINLGDA